MSIFVNSFAKFCALGIIITLTQGCGMSYTEKFSYVPKEQLNYDTMYMVAKPEMQKTSNYGAIKFQEEDANDDEGNLFVIQRRKGIYQAETMFYKDDNKRYYFNFGMHRREKTPSLGIRVEW